MDPHASHGPVVACMERFVCLIVRTSDKTTRTHGQLVCASLNWDKAYALYVETIQERN